MKWDERLSVQTHTEKHSDEFSEIMQLKTGISVCVQGKRIWCVIRKCVQFYNVLCIIVQVYIILIYFSIYQNLMSQNLVLKHNKFVESFDKTVKMWSVFICIAVIFLCLLITRKSVINTA